MPFFHNMAEKITQTVGEDQPDAVIATTIVAYAISAMVTGLVFYLMGKFHFGYMVGFIPRHILIGCIGGVGWFLVATGFEVSARLDGNLEYDLDTLRKLMQSDTVLLWMFPLVLAIALFWGQSKVSSKFFLPAYIICIPVIFYFFVFAIDVLNPDTLRDSGWIFDGPPAGEPWWYFYTLYRESDHVAFYLPPDGRRANTDPESTVSRIRSGQMGRYRGDGPGYAGLDFLRNPPCSHQRACPGPQLRRRQR